MRTRLLLAASLLTGCDLLSPNDHATVAITLPLCGDNAIVATWAKMSGDSMKTWTPLTLVDGVVTFQAENDVTIAYGNDVSSRVITAWAPELRDLTCARTEQLTKVLGGSVIGVDQNVENLTVVIPQGEITWIDDTRFAAYIPAGGVDLFAYTTILGTSSPDKVIFRHDVDGANNSEMNQLDFESDEARSFESGQLTVNGLTQPVPAFSVLSVGGAEQSLAYSLAYPTAPATYFGIASALLGPRDNQWVRVSDYATEPWRDMTYFFRSARAVTVSLGEPASLPSASVLTETPCLRLHASIPSQSDYPDFARAIFIVQGPTGSPPTVVDVAVTHDALGATPALWELDTPDVTRPDGSCLLPSNATSWSVGVTVGGGRLALTLGGKANEGEVARSSTIRIEGLTP